MNPKLRRLFLSLLPIFFVQASVSGEEQVTCSSVPLEMRFDCHPESTPTIEKCEQRGCCYDDSIEEPERKLPRFPNPLIKIAEENVTVAPPPSLPVCFFPNDYVSYNFSSLSQDPMGPYGILKRTSLSGFPDDVMELRIDFLYETDSRIRVRIYDPANPDRHEPNFPEVPEVDSPASDPSYSVVIDEAKGTFAVLRKDTEVPVFDTRGAAPLVFADQFLQLSSFLSSNYIYGIGQHLDGFLLDTHWHRRFLWNYDTGPKPYVNLYGSHPFYINIEDDGKFHGVFLLNSNGIDVILQPTPAITFRPIGGILDLYVFLGPSPSDVIQQYTDVIGKPFMPPYWSLGYHQCRYDYYTTNRTREVWQQTIDAEIPFDVQWNDIDYMEIFKDFTIDPINYEGLAEFVNDVHEKGMHYVIVTDPGLDSDDPPGTYFPYDNGTAEGIFIMDSEGNQFIGETWCKNYTAFPDFTNPRTRELWEEYIRLFHEELEFDGVWLDMNEPSNFDNRFEVCNFSNPLNNPPYLPPNSEQSDKWLYYRTVCMDAQQHDGLHYDLHNMYGTMETIATSNAIKNIRNERPFVISRSSFAGHGKYAGHWTGDTSSRWYQMWLSIGDIMNFNLFGIPMVGADICGFGENTTVPLCTRWYQVGAFYPFARNHNNEFCIPQDPVSLGEPVITSARNSLTQRYLLLPFLYSLFFRSHVTGEPVVKPLFFEFPKDVQTYVIDSEFLWGEGLLFAPVLVEDATSVEAYIPEGIWYDWYTGNVMVNSTTGIYTTIESDLVNPNIIGRGGYVITCQEPGLTTTESRNNNFTLRIFLDRNGEATGELYWDDGYKLDPAENRRYTWVQFNVTDSVLSNTVQLLGYSRYLYVDEIRISGVESFSGCYLNGKVFDCEYDALNKVLIAPDIEDTSLAIELNLTWN